MYARTHAVDSYTYLNISIFGFDTSYLNIVNGEKWKCAREKNASNSTYSPYSLGTISVPTDPCFFSVCCYGFASLSR